MQTPTYSRNRCNRITAWNPLQNGFRVLHTEEVIGSSPVSPTHSVSDEWGTTPTDTDRLSEWANRVVAKRTEHDPRVIDATQSIEAVNADGETMCERHEQERLGLLVSEYGVERVRRDLLGMRIANPYRTASDARAEAATVRAEAEELRGLPIPEAAQRIEAKRAEQGHARQRAAERARQLSDPFEHVPHRSSPNRDGPTRGL